VNALTCGRGDRRGGASEGADMKIEGQRFAFALRLEGLRLL